MIRGGHMFSKGGGGGYSLLSTERMTRVNTYSVPDSTGVFKDSLALSVYPVTWL